jgi:hypothetical protein
MPLRYKSGFSRGHGARTSPRVTLQEIEVIHDPHSFIIYVFSPANRQSRSPQVLPLYYLLLEIPSSPFPSTIRRPFLPTLAYLPMCDCE